MSRYRRSGSSAADCRPPWRHPGFWPERGRHRQEARAAALGGAPVDIMIERIEVVLGHFRVCVTIGPPAELPGFENKILFSLTIGALEGLPAPGADKKIVRLGFAPDRRYLGIAPGIILGVEQRSR